VHRYSPFFFPPSSFFQRKPHFACKCRHLGQEFFSASPINLLSIRGFDVPLGSPLGYFPSCSFAFVFPHFPHGCPTCFRLNSPPPFRPLEGPPFFFSEEGFLAHSASPLVEFFSGEPRQSSGGRCLYVQSSELCYTSIVLFLVGHFHLMT